MPESDITIHWQGMTGWAPEFVRRSGVRYVKLIDPPGQDPFPGTRTIGRTYMPDHESNGMVWDGAAGGEAWFNHWRPFYESRPWVWCWEGPNEPQPMENATFRGRLNEFTVRWAQLMKARGWRTVGMCWGVGWPDVHHAPQMGAGVQACDYLGLHEYSAPTMQDMVGWHCLRYRRTVAELQGAGYSVPPILITECGIDGGVLGQQFARKGWITFTDGNEDAYLDQLKWYDGELRKDPLVEAATVFVAGPNEDWKDFDVTESLAMKMADYINGGGPGPEPPDPEPPPEGGDVETIVLDAWGVVRDSMWLLENYGPVGVSASEGAEYATVVLQEIVEAPATLVVSVRDGEDPVPGVEVRFSWPDGSVPGVTNDQGDVGFGMGGGAYYFPPDSGPHWIDCGGVRVDGLGMLGGTPHNHVNVGLLKGAPGPPDYNPLDGVLIYDRDGDQKTALWAHEMYGKQDLHEPPDAKWELAALVESGPSDSPVLRVKVIDSDEQPIVGKLVKLGSRSIDPAEQDKQYTQIDGVAEFDISADWLRYSAMDGQGPAAVMVGNGLPAEVYNSVGVVMGRNDWLNVVFRDTKPPEDDRAKGIDVSDHQGGIDWQAVRAAGYSFAFIRASVCRSDGSVVEDARFAENWQGAGSAGLLRGVYHYLGTEARQQAAFFVDTVGAREPELGWWGDLEHPGLNAQRCGEFLEAVDRNLAGRGMCDVYSRASFLDALGAIPWAENRDLWIASPGQPEPVMPDAWEDWTFWQAGQAEVDGVVGVDKFHLNEWWLHEIYGDDDPEPPDPDDCCEQQLAKQDEIIALLTIIAAKS